MASSNPSPFEQCVLASGLLDEAQLGAARQSVRWSDGAVAAVDAPPSDQQLADRLVELGLLNAWQAGQLLEGRTKFNLGPYRIIDSIGQGGMGQVFKAVELTGLERTLAVKVLPRDKATPETIANFANEIRTLSRLSHHRLVRAVDSGHDGNVYFLVTEYVPGMDLRKLVRRDGPLGMEAAAIIISQVAEGLAHAHEQGLVHRDVKPGNVLVTPEGDAKLSDLGLAGPLEGDAESDPRFGKIVGTADYLSPDHIRSPWEPTPAWDIYSLGCTLYYAVTGKVPFPGGTTADKARAHLELRPLDPKRLNPALSSEFVDVLADMMAKEPGQRIASAEEVIVRLAPWTRRRNEPGSVNGNAAPPVRRGVSNLGISSAEIRPEGRLADTMPMNDEPVVAETPQVRLPQPALVSLEDLYSAGYLQPGFVLRRPVFSIWERYWWFWTIVLPIVVTAVALLFAVSVLTLARPRSDRDADAPSTAPTAVQPATPPDAPLHSLPPNDQPARD